MFASLQSWHILSRGWRRLIMTLLALPLVAFNMAFATPQSAMAASSLPGWWTGDCDSGNGQLITTDPTLGVQICYPTNWNGDKNTQPNDPEKTKDDAVALLEWQCVEFSARYLEQFHKMPNKGSAQGYQVASSYYSWYSDSVPGLSLITGGSTHTHMFPSVGDVLSTTSGDPSNGHTGVINYVHIDDASAGNGYVMLAQQNVAGGNAGWLSDGTGTNMGWGDHSFPYTKLVISGWNYYNDDNSPMTSENGVQILHFGSGNPIISTKLVYAVGTDQVGNSHLYEFWPNNTFTSWSERDLNSTTGDSTNLVGYPSADWLKQSGQIVHDIYVTGAEGNIHEFYYINSNWYSNNLSQYNGSYSPTFTQSPFGYSYYDSNKNPYHAVYVVGTDGYLYTYTWASTSTWSIARTSPPSGTTFTGTPTAYSYNTNGDQVVYVITSDGKLREYSNPIGNTGSLGNPINTFSLPNGYSASGQPSAYSYSDGAGTHHFVYVKGSNGQLYAFYYDPTQKTWNYTTPAAMLPGGIVPTGSPNVHPSFQSATPIQFGFVTDSAGAAYEMYSQSNTPSSWTQIGGGADPDGDAVTGSPVAFTFTYSTTTTHNVFFSESDGNLHLEYYPSFTNGWAFTSLPAVSDASGSVSFSGATPSAYVVPVGA